MGFGIYLFIHGQFGWHSHDGVKKDVMHALGGYSVIVLYILSLISGFFLKFSFFTKKKRILEVRNKLHYPTFFHKVSSHAAHFLACV
jgi:hypothetical protein